MKVGFAFRNVDSSDMLMEYMTERLEKLGRFEMNPMDVHIVVSKTGHECSIDVTMVEGRRKYKAMATTDDFYRAADMCVNKLQRQLSKERRRTHDMNQRRPEISTEGKIARLTPRLESDFSRVLGRDVSRGFKKSG